MAKRNMNSDPNATREQRLKQALQANLQRRKAQAKVRAKQDDDDAGETKADKDQDGQAGNG